jgi:CheY-like chemotaxis protein
MPVAYATTSRAALDIAEQQQVAVAVLDQRLDGDISGTDLFLRLRRVRPGIKAIMLTGQALGDEVGQALRLGFDDYLAKSNIAELPVRVMQQYLRHVADTAGGQNELDILVWPARPWMKPWQRLEIRARSLAVVEDRVIDHDAWRTLQQVNAGEERKVTHQLTSSQVTTLEESSQNALKATLSLNNRALSALTASLENTLTVTAKQSLATTNTSVSTTEQLLKLAAEPTDTSQVFVRARLFQAAPVRRKVVVTLRLHCGCCQLARYLPLVMMQDTGLVATRHKDHMSDGTIREVETGDIARP